ncbi:MAG: hypothetical protein WAO55_07360 [Candidatus Manganitrophaceae bacterium]
MTNKDQGTYFNLYEDNQPREPVREETERSQAIEKWPHYSTLFF